MTKTAMITIAGRPNVGKSTLTNYLVGEKIAIVSNKPQTTRNRICGILTRGDTQFVFVDTPGYHKPRTKLGDYMVGVTKESIADVDLTILVVEPIASIGPQEQGLIEQIKGQPTTAEGGFWHKKLYPQQMWLDGIYMACPFLTEFAVTFGEMQWADLAAKQMALIFDKTRLESGLHAHAWDSARVQKWADPQTGLSPHVWGRAMGWFVMAHADVLAVLPESHPAYARLSLQMKSLLHAVMAARGTDKLWHQVMDRPESAENYAESSCSAMFIYGLAKGKALGLCGAKEEAAARESMDALWAQNVVTAADGYPELTRICKVAGLGGEPYRDGSYGYYVHETVCSGDTKGTAPFLMACCALEV